MEEFGSVSVDKLITDYSGVKNGTTKVISFDIAGTKFNPNASDYSIKVTMDPESTDTTGDYYSWNNMNVSNIDNISGDACAVYAMREDADNAVFEAFVQKSQSAADLSPSTYYSENKDFFKSKCSRKIELTIKKGLPILDPETGSTVDNVKVSVKITYSLAAADNVSHSKNVLPASDCTYSVTHDVYDNKSSKVPFSAVYLFFYPLLNDADDIVTIINNSNVPCVAYVLKESRGEVESAYLHYLTTINVYEKPLWYAGAHVPDGKTASTSLRTNLFKEATTLSSTKKYFKIYYRYSDTERIYDTVTAGNMTDAYRIFNLKTADGRRFDDKASNDRIYKVKVEVIKGTGEDAQTIATLTGTKLE